MYTRQDVGFVVTVIVGGGSNSWLSLRRGGKEFRFAAAHIRDGLDPIRELIFGLGQVVDADHAVSVEWKSEPGGVFLTFGPEDAADASSGSSFVLAVYDFADPAWYRSDWDSRRGALLFEAVGRKFAIVSAFSAAVEAAEESYREVAERRSYRYKFPREELDNLQRVVAAKSSL